MKNNDVLLEVKNLTIDFYTFRGVLHVIDNVSLKIKKGEFFGLAGESGCGKTMTAMSIIRLLPNNAKIVQGEILFNKEDLLKKRETELNHIRGKEISMIFQDPSRALNPVFTIGEQIKNIIKAHKNISDKEAEELALNLLKEVRLPRPEKILTSYPHELSGGMKQRVVIAMAIAHEPKLLIADEPTTALDVTVQDQILRMLKRVNREKGVSILFITHDMSIIANFCDRVAIMYAGKIVEIGSTRDVFTNPLHPYSRGLISSIPRFGNKDKELPRIPGEIPNFINPPKGCRFYPRCSFYKKGCCDSEEPIMIEYEKDHYVACHLYR